MIDTTALLRKLDEERRSLSGPEDALQLLPHVSRVLSESGKYGGIPFSALSASNADAVIAEQAAYFRDHQVQAEWTAFAHDSPPDLLERLKRHGFQIGELEAVLVLDLGANYPWIEEQSPYKTVCVENEEQLALFRDAAEAISGKDWGFTTGVLRKTFGHALPNERAYITFENDTVVSIGRLCTNPASIFGGFYGGMTRESHRHRGYYRANVAARARAARKSHVQYLRVDARPTSRPILERLGFERLTDTWPCNYDGRGQS